MQRKKFLFIVLLLYTPSSLAGGQLPNGIRVELANVFSTVSPCVISNNIADVYFIYQQCKDFLQDIGFVYCRILEKIKFNGILLMNIYLGDYYVIVISKVVDNCKLSIENSVIIQKDSR